MPRASAGPEAGARANDGTVHRLMRSQAPHGAVESTAMTPDLRRKWPLLGGVVALILPLGLHVRTLAPTVYNLDSAELTTAAATGGIVRATGYPLYLALGRVWTSLPVGDVGYRMNLLSAVAGAGTIVLAYKILKRPKLGIGHGASFGALGLLAVAPAFWSMSVVAEVYTLHALLMAALIFAALCWADDPSRADRAAAVGVVLGLTATHHAASVLLIPGLLAFAVVAAPNAFRQPRLIAAAGLGFLAGLLPILYLPIRHAAGPAFNYAGAYDAAGSFHPVDLQQPMNILWLMSGRSFATQMLGYTLPQIFGELWQQVIVLNRAFLGVGLGPGLVGAVVLFRRNRPLALFLVLSAVCNAVFFAAYRVVDKETMYLALYLIWALWVAVGYQWLLDWVRARSDSIRCSSRLAFSPAALLGTAMAAAVVLGAIMTWPLADRSGDYSARRRGEQVLAVVEKDALVVGWWDTVPVVEYLQLVEGSRPDVQAINRFLISHEALTELLSREIDERPVYVDSVPASLLSEVDVTDADPLLRLRPAKAGR